MLAYASKSCNKVERNYSSYEGEMLAMVFGVQVFRPYLHGVRFVLYTDHEPLRWLMESTQLKGKLARWALLLMEYDFEILYRAGTQQGHVDALSRMRSVQGTLAALAEEDDSWARFPEAGSLTLGGERVS